MIRIQVGGCRHTEFLKTAVNSLLFNHSHSIWWECCEPDIKRKCFVEKIAQCPKPKRATAAILNFEDN